MEKTRLTLRLPPDLASQAAAVAAHQGLTLNAFIVQAVRNWADYQGKRLARSSPSADGPARTAVPLAMPAPARIGVRSSPPLAVPNVGAKSVPKVGANQPCSCGSGKKYKRCHGQA